MLRAQKLSIKYFKKKAIYFDIIQIYRIFVG